MLMKYAERHMLPTRRLQAQLAHLARITAGSGTLADHLFKYRPEVADADAVPEAVAAANVLAGITGGSVKVLGRKRREREALH